MIEPMMKRLHAARARQTGTQRPEGQAAWRNSYDDIAIPVHAEIVAAQMTVAALLQLRKGEVIELPASILEAAHINVAGKVRFTARAGQQDGFIAVQITDKTLTPKK
jgi:flagellar motor switch protein FliM